MTTPQDNKTGYIDIHAHLIPAVDDGCRDVDETITCVNRLKAAGYIGSVCTPHLMLAIYPDNLPRHVAGWVDDLQQQLRDRGVDYQLWPGGELQINDDTLSWVQDVGLRPLGDGKCVLCDTWQRQWTDALDRLVDYIQRSGYRVVLAHPERMQVDHLTSLLDDLTGRGVWLQGNFNSLVGAEGPTAHQWALQLLREDRYQFLAMDLHRIDTIDTRLEGLLTAEMMVGPDRLRELIGERPRQIVSGESVV